MLAENFKIILASKSPRRQELIKGLQIPFETVLFDVDESYENSLIKHEIPLFLALKKAEFFPNKLMDNEILLTADTVVWVNNHVLNKPENDQEAFKMLSEICGTTHEVFTGVCLKSHDKIISFYERTEVKIKNLSDDEIWHYINQYNPLDKAGSYGIQDWFGYIAVESINGCFYNVMGLPINKVYDNLKNF
jgi:septum formation protein